MIRTYFDEMYDAGGQVRPHYREFARWLSETPDELWHNGDARPICCFIAPGLLSRSTVMSRDRAPDSLRHHSAQHSRQ